MSVLARAPEAASAAVGTASLLDGRASTGAVSYLWEVLAPTDGATLHAADQPVATFTADRAGSFVVRLTCTDLSGEPSAALTAVTVTAPSVVVDGPAEGGDAQRLVFTATGHDVPAGVGWTWSVAGPSDAATPRTKAKDATFVLVTDGAGRYTVTASAKVGQHVVASDDHEVSVSTVESAASADTEWWQEQLVVDQRKALSDVKAAAVTWQGYTAGILSLFSTVTILAGPDAVSDVQQPEVAGGVILLMVAAFGLALGGVLKLARVTASAYGIGKGLTGTEYREQTLGAVNAAVGRFRLSRHLTLAAAGALGLASAVVIGAAIFNVSPSTHLLIRTKTDTYCVDVEAGSGGRLKVKGEPIGATESVAVVSSCG